MNDYDSKSGETATTTTESKRAQTAVRVSRCGRGSLFSARLLLARALKQRRLFRPIRSGRVWKRAALIETCLATIRRSLRPTGTHHYVLLALDSLVRDRVARKLFHLDVVEFPIFFFESAMLCFV